jgi:hypothetical protein
MKAKQIAEDNDDGDCADFKQDVHDTYSTRNDKLEVSAINFNFTRLGSDC